MARISIGTNGTTSVSTKTGDKKNNVRTTVSVNKNGKTTVSNTVKTGAVSTKMRNGKVTGFSLNLSELTGGSKKKSTTTKKTTTKKK